MVKFHFKLSGNGECKRKLSAHKNSENQSGKINNSLGCAKNSDIKVDKKRENHIRGNKSFHLF